MLSGVGLEQKFWAEVVITACYLINRSPTSALVEKTPMEVWSNKKPSLRHLRVFGCEAYAHVPSVKRSKLDNKVVMYIFIGYGVYVKGYKLWDPIAEKVLYSRSVIFCELKPSTIILQSEKEEKQKKEVVHLPTTSKGEELRTLYRIENEESLSSFGSSEEEQEPKPQTLRRSTRDRQQPDRFGYSPKRFGYYLLDL